MAGQAPDVRITVSLPGEPAEDLTLSYPLDPRYGELLREIHDHHAQQGVVECRMHDDDPQLAHLQDSTGRVRGVWMYLREIRDAESQDGATRLILCHWPNNPAGPGSHDVPRPMTEEHIRGQEYVAERGRDFGYDVVVNRAFSTENLCRADVRVFGSAATLAAEIQVSRVKTSTVLARTREARRAGATSVWFPTMKNPLWEFKVPCITTNQVVELGPRTWKVTTGARLLEDERCTPTSRFESCPLTGRRHCGRYHPLWMPMALVAGRSFTVDDIVEQFPGGGFVRLDAGERQGVILTTPADRDKWLAFEAEKAAVKGKPVAPRRQARDRRLKHSDYSAQLLRERLERESDRSASVALCEQCADALRAPYLPAGYVFCDPCRSGVSEWLLSDPRAGRLCSVCNKPLPRTAIHATKHGDCANANEAAA